MAKDNSQIAMEDMQQTIYKELGYKSYPFPFTTPAYLEAYGALVGLNTPPAKTARVLELGATYGGNIISQAVFNPEATFVGIELSQDQVPKDYKGGAEKFNEDRGRFREEKDIRLAILDAINTRRDFIIIFKDRSQVIRKGSWSYLDCDFSNTYFFYDVNFNYIYFGASSNFSGAIFTQDANFSGAIFTEGVDFSGTTFHKEPIFINELDYARFSYRIDPEDYNFKVSDYSRCKIETEEQEHNGVKFIIPKDTELFDPDKSYDLEDNEDI